MRRRYVLAPQAARDLATAFDWKGFWDMAAHVGTLVGLTAAGVWGYFNFIKSRTYHPRLEMTVSGELRSKGVQQYLVPRVTLKNIGNSKVKLIQSGSGYRIWTTKREEADETRELVWRGEAANRFSVCS